MSVQTLGPFGHHPDLSTDYCCEVDALEGYAYEVSVGSARWPVTGRSEWPFWGRLSRALRLSKMMGEELPEDEYTVRAREVLTHLEARALGKEPHPFVESRP